MNTINNNVALQNVNFNSRKPRAKFLYTNPNLMQIKDSVDLTMRNSGKVKTLKDLYNLKAIVDKIKQNPKETAFVALLGTTILKAALSKMNANKSGADEKNIPLKNKEARRANFHARMQQDIVNYASAIDKAAEEKQLNSIAKNIENSFMCNYQALTDVEIQQLDALLNRINTRKKNLTLGNILLGLQNNAQKKVSETPSPKNNDEVKPFNNRETVKINIPKPDIASINTINSEVQGGVTPQNNEEIKPQYANLVIKPPIKQTKQETMSQGVEDMTISSQAQPQNQANTSQNSDLVIRPAVRQGNQNGSNNNRVWQNIKNFFKNPFKGLLFGTLLMLSALFGINRCNNQSQNNNGNQDKPTMTIVNKDTTNVQKDTVSSKQDTLSVKNDTISAQPSVVQIPKEKTSDYIVKKGDNVWNITKMQLQKDNGKNAKNSVITVETRKNVKDNNLHYEKDNYTVIIQPGDTLKIRTYNQN